MSRTTTVDTVPAGEVSVAGASRPDPFIKSGTPPVMRGTLALVEQRESDAHKLRGATFNKRIRAGCTSDADLARRHGVNGCCTTHREFLG